MYVTSLPHALRQAWRKSASTFRPGPRWNHCWRPSSTSNAPSRRPERRRWHRILARSSFLLNEVAVRDRSVVLADGDVVDVLPPFAGG